MSSYTGCNISSKHGRQFHQESLSYLLLIRTFTNNTQPGCRCGRLSSYTNKIITYGDIMLIGKFSTKYNENQLCLITYLKSQVKPGANFFKSKYIAKDTGLSSKEVGTNMAILSEICPDFRIERYSYSNSTTWMITVPTL